MTTYLKSCCGVTVFGALVETVHDGIVGRIHDHVREDASGTGFPVNLY